MKRKRCSSNIEIVSSPPKNQGILNQKIDGCLERAAKVTNEVTHHEVHLTTRKRRGERDFSGHLPEI